MLDIYRTSFRYFFASLPMLILFAGIVEGGLWALQPKFPFAIELVPLTLVAYYFHRHFLFGEDFSFRASGARGGTPNTKWGWFVLASIGMILVPVVVSVPIVIALAGPTSSRGAIQILMLLILFPTYLVTLGLFGTLLPALVARDHAYRLVAGMRTFFPMVGHLILGPGLIGFISAALAIWIQTVLPPDPGSMTELVVFILERTLGFLPTILAVAVLCEMYRRVMQNLNEAALAQFSNPPPAGGA